MTPEEARVLAQVVAERSKNTGLRLLPATVQSTRSEGTFVTVRVDGDDLDQFTDCTTLVYGAAPGQRVMVAFDPPRGVYVVGIIGGGPSAGTLYYEGRASGTANTLTLSDSVVVPPGRRVAVTLVAYATINDVYPGYDPAVQGQPQPFVNAFFGDPDGALYQIAVSEFLDPFEWGGLFWQLTTTGYPDLRDVSISPIPIEVITTEGNDYVSVGVSFTLTVTDVGPVGPDRAIS
jgi:hypothetical protein